MTTLAAWGPTIVMAFAILAAAYVGLRVTRDMSRGKYELRPQGGPSASILLAALREAESVNSYRPASSGNPRAYPETVIRLAPTKYRDGVIEIPRRFSDGHVVSIDLGHMDHAQAARLVDFCSGYLIGTSGWLFRATNTVIVLTPTRPMAANSPPYADPLRSNSLCHPVLASRLRN